MGYIIPKGTAVTLHRNNQGKGYAYETKEDLYFVVAKTISTYRLIVFEYGGEWQIILEKERVIKVDKDGNRLGPDWFF